MRMATRIPRDLHLYLVVDRTQMKMIDAKYNVKVGYWALRNNMQKYKIFATLIQMFDPNFMNNFQQAFGDDPWPVKLIN